MAITVAVVGVGLIGGSFALAVRQAGIANRVIGVSSPATISKAQSLGIVDAGLPLEDAIPQADLVFLSATIYAIIDVLPKLQGLVKPGAVVTDAGSTKRAIVRRAQSVDGLTFIGGHPMAGKEQSGVEQAEASLFQGRPWVLTPTSASNDDQVGELRDMLEQIGADTMVMSPEDHDAAVARTSHLPQLLSTALAASLDQHFREETPVIAGPGLLDATRLAQSPFVVWRDILETNQDEVLDAVDALLQTLQDQREVLGGDVALGDQFERAGAFARRLRNR